MLRGGFCPEASLPSRGRDPSVAKSTLSQGDMIMVLAYPLFTLSKNQKQASVPQSLYGVIVFVGQGVSVGSAGMITSGATVFVGMIVISCWWIKSRRHRIIIRASRGFPRRRRCDFALVGA